MKKSTKWFLAILGILFAVALVGILLFVSLLVRSSSESTETVTTGRGQKIAVVELKGEIKTSEDVIRQLKKYRADHAIKAILLHIDSPGGAVVPSQEMYQEVRRTREGGTPVIVSMGSLAASGGYYVSCGATRIVANPGTLTGSIGVISEFLQVHDALGKLGIEVKTIKAGKLKDAGVETKQMTEEDQKYFQTLIDDVHQQFIAVVEQERNLSHERVLGLADGRAFTGDQALAAGLVDTLGTFEDAVAIAAEIAGIKGEPSLVKEHRRPGWFGAMFENVDESVKEMKDAVLHRPALSYRFVGPGE